jgi:integrase
MDPPLPCVSPHAASSELDSTHVTEFLSSLATRWQVSASTQNQALSAIVFLYRSVLSIELGAVEGIVRATTPRRLPVVLSRTEVAAILGRLDGTAWLVVALLYGAGLRLQEALELRVKDVDFERGRLIVRQGKGRKDRVALLPERVKPRLATHLDEVRYQHEEDVAAGFGRVPLPEALDRKYPAAVNPGRGSSCSRRGDCAAIRDGGRRVGFTFMSRRFSEQSQRRFVRQGSRRGRAVTRSGIRLRRTCSKTGMTSAQSRSCSGTRM